MSYRRPKPSREPEGARTRRLQGPRATAVLSNSVAGHTMTDESHETRAVSGVGCGCPRERAVGPATHVTSRDFIEIGFRFTTTVTQLKHTQSTVLADYVTPPGHFGLCAMAWHAQSLRAGPQAHRNGVLVRAAVFT